jgi:putative glutathione S-transferase
MGHLIDGTWNNDDVATSDDKGKFKREASRYRSTISKDDKDHSEHKYYPEADRYHLYVSYACPWAHRTLITRKLKGLGQMISVDVVHPHMLDHSWTFSKDFKAATGDSLYNKDYLYQIYQLDNPKASTKVTVPVLWDKKTKTIVNNESSEIIRILNSNFKDFATSDIDLYPARLKDQIDEMNQLTYEPINNGVYKTGFAKKQSAYEEAFKTLFASLDQVDKMLQGKDYLVGDTLTEADIRLITTLLRFDSVYYVHFKCNYKKISEYKNLRYVRPQTSIISKAIIITRMSLLILTE